MERWERPPPRRGGGRENPSFSSTLLDAIYRSIDDEAGGGARDPRPPPSASRRQAEKAVPRRKHERRGFNNSTSSSSDCSSYGGFSSSEAESAIHPGLRPIRTGGHPASRSAPPPPIPPPPVHQRENTKKKESSIGRKFRDLRKAKPPASPGARLAGFLNSLFSAAGSPRKARVSTPVAAAEESTCSTASSYSRSCLSKTPSTRESLRPPKSGGAEKRSVRFYPVSVIVDEECRPCGHKCLHDGDPTVWPPVAAGIRGRQTKNRVEEMLRGFEDDDDGESDSSSDLFELENLTAIGGGGRYRDELPVYESTQFRAHRAIAQGFNI